LQEVAEANRRIAAMGQPRASTSRLCEGEQRALAAFLSGRLPAGQLNGELCRAREEALAAAAAPPPAPERPPALRAA
jgi:hypothetical protein